MDISEISTTTGTTGVLLVFSIICWIAMVGSKSKTKRNLPPSLPHIPILGSLPFLYGLSNLHICLTEKCKKYGNVFSMLAGSKYIVVLNGHETIREALVKNSAEYSGRGELYIVKYIWKHHEKGVVVVQASDRQRKTRSACLTVLKNFGFGSRTIMEERIQAEVSHLLEYIRSKNGKAWYPALILEHSTMNVTHNLLFSKRFRYDDSVGKQIRDTSHIVCASIKALHGYLPIITKLPNVRRQLIEDLAVYEKYIAFWRMEVEESIRSDTDTDNFVREFFKVTEKDLFDVDDMTLIIRDLMIAGTETTSGQLNWALILLANHPDIQSRLQQEIDSVVPRDRLPSLDDKAGLSYLDAVVLEVFRIKTAVPLSVPRLTLEDTNIGGYEIPAGTEVMVNLWSANMDPEVWKEPERFNPDRFLDENNSIINKDLVISFSHGKRSCIGEILARHEMFLILSALVQQFHFLPPEGEAKISDDTILNLSLTALKHNIRMVARN